MGVAEFYDVLQEVEEDKKRAEQEGMLLHSRKGKADDLTITINKSSNVSYFIPAQTHNHQRLERWPYKVCSFDCVASGSIELTVSWGFIFSHCLFAW